MNFLNRAFSGEKNKSLPADGGSKEVASKTINREGFEYLRADIKPIMACIGTRADFKDYPGPTTTFEDPKHPKPVDNAHHVDYWGNPIELRAKGYKNQADYTYVISVIDNKDKFSNGFKNCTGLLVAGRDKKTNENISFLSHQDPQYFLLSDKEKQEFITDLKQRITEMKEKCADGTIDARIVGGNYYSNGNFEENYLKSIELLSSETSKILGFEPIVSTGPKTHERGGQDDVFYDNENRRLYILRPEVGNATTEPFEPKNIENQKKKWPKVSS